MATRTETRSRTTFLLAAALAPMVLAACSPHGGQGDNSVAAAMPAATSMPSVAAPVPSASATPSPAAAVSRAEKTDLLDFGYKYPALSVPEVAAMLATRADDAKAKAFADARNDQQQAKKSNFPFHAHEYSADWAVAADTPRFLSLVGTIYAYTGGAHGMTVFDPLLWDKQAGKALDAAALFTSHDAMESALRQRFCDVLDRERAKKRGAPVTHDDQPFNECIDPAKEVIVPTANGSGAIDGFTVYVAPYDAGPYAEGDYQVTLPIDAALLRAVKPAYRDAFAAP